MTTDVVPKTRVKSSSSPFVTALPAAEAAIVEERLTFLREEGARVKYGWPERLRDRPPLPGAEEWWYGPRELTDHAYTIRFKDGRRQLYAEPYGLDDEELATLAALNAGGEWEARIGQFPLWYPGRTTQIVYTQNRKGE